MCSGSYFPPPVRRVDIPKGDSGGTRPLGIPTVSDRIAQMVVKRYLEPILESVFHKDSYGYRPGKSAHDALVVARRRCWDYDWVLDLDIKSFFDEIDWSLLMLAVRRHTDCKWVLLYLEGCVAKLKVNTCDLVTSSDYAAVARPNRPLMNATCPVMSPFANHLTCPFRTMFTVSIP